MRKLTRTEKRDQIVIGLIVFVGAGWLYDLFGQGSIILAFLAVMGQLWGIVYSGRAVIAKTKKTKRAKT